jgi:hypothetical protein
VHHQAILIVLPVVAEVHRLPELIVIGKKALAVFISLVRRAGRFGGAILENDFALREVLPECLARAE